MPREGTIDPRFLERILGSTFVHAISDSKGHARLRIGRDTWSAIEVAGMGIVQTRACAILSHICDTLQIKSTADLYAHTSPYTFASHPAGVTTLYVMFAAFRDKGLNPDAWYHRDAKGAIVSFIALKHRELIAERRTQAEAKSRRRRRAARAQRTASAAILANSPPS